MNFRVSSVLRRLFVLPEPDDSGIEIDVAVGTKGDDPARPNLLGIGVIKLLFLRH
jgi:hypothetical protein